MENPKDDGIYLVTNDGTKIHGGTIYWNQYLALPHIIRVGDRRFYMLDIKGYRFGGSYYARTGWRYVERLVHGPINVYWRLKPNNDSSSYDLLNDTRRRVVYYSQRGDDGPIVRLSRYSRIKKLVRSCPRAYEMANKSTLEIKEAIGTKADYLNQVFEIYDNGCRSLDSAR